MKDIPQNSENSKLAQDPADGLLGIYVCRLTSLDDLPRVDRKDRLKILAVLAEVKRFSCFDVCDKMAGPLTWILQESGWVETTQEGFPWTAVLLTKKGRDALKARP